METKKKMHMILGNEEYTQRFENHNTYNFFLEKCIRKRIRKKNVLGKRNRM